MRPLCLALLPAAAMLLSGCMGLGDVAAKGTMIFEAVDTATDAAKDRSIRYTAKTLAIYCSRVDLAMRENFRAKLAAAWAEEAGKDPAEFDGSAVVHCPGDPLTRPPDPVPTS